MSELRPALVRIGTLRVSGGSGISPAIARRLAEAVPAALERALAGWPALPDIAARGCRTALQRQADAVALEVMRAVRERLAGGPESRR